MSNLVIPDGGTIGSASDTDAISIPANGKPTFSAGIANTGTIDAGTLGSSIVNNLSFIGFSGSTNGATSFSSSADIIPFDQEVVSNGMTILTGGNAGKIQVDKAGKYLVISNAYGQHTASGSAYFAIHIYLNSSKIAGSGAVGETANAMRQNVSCQVIIQCAVNDTLHTQTLINGDTIFGGSDTRMVIIYLGQ